jgi:hypothetical protein
MKISGIILTVLIISSSVIKAQTNKTDYLSINIIPILGSTLELGYERNFNPHFNSSIYCGYVFNSHLGSIYKIGTSYELKKKSGVFVKIGTRINFRKDDDKFAPFFGLNVINSLAIEEGINDPDFNESTPGEFIERNSYNLGFSGILGLTSPSSKKLSMDLGLQIGYVIINNLVDFHSYMPGMGTNFDGPRFQGVLRIKYKI